MIHKFSMIYYL